MSAIFIDSDGKAKMRIASDGGTEPDGYIFIDSDGFTKVRVKFDGSIDIPPGSITDEDLEHPKVNRAGDTMTGPLVFADPNNRSKVILTKYPDGTGHNNAPTTFDKTSVYLHLGGTEYNTNSYRLIGFGYRHYQDSSHAAGVIGYQETSGSGNDMGRLIFATRNVTTDTEPTIRLTIEPNGQILIESGYVPGSDDAVPNKKYVDDQISAIQAAAQADSTATDVAGLVADFNTLLANLRTAGIIAT